MKTLDLKPLNKFAKTLGVTITERLGNGAQGVAYLLSDNTVLKITKYSNEYYTSTDLVGKKLKHLCRVYATYKITYKDETWYGIREEKLITTIKPKIDDFENSSRINYNVCDTIRSGCKDKHANERFKDILSFYPEHVEYAKEYRKMALACRRQGMSNADLHSGNIGQREEDGNLVYFDFGCNNSYSGNDGTLFNLTPKGWKPEPKVDDDVVVRRSAMMPKLVHRAFQLDGSNLGEGVVLKAFNKAILKLKATHKIAFNGLRGKNLGRALQMID